MPGDELTAELVRGAGAMTGRKTNPPAKPTTNVTSSVMIVLPCNMARTFNNYATILLESR